MIKPTLLILAAGLGSRYGGIKQLDALGPNGETIMDYSIQDAIAAGFGKIVFVIRRSIKQDFDNQILKKYKDRITVETVFQELDMLPDGFTRNEERVKPYGTAHAILVAKEKIQEPFAVINADDFYGKEAFTVMAEFLRTSHNETVPTFSMIGYRLENTLSENGSVSRGVSMANEDGELVKITEMTKIQRVNGEILNLADNPPTLLSGKEPVSMNFWGFTPYFFECLQTLFIQFLTENNDNPTAEFPIPSVITHFIHQKTVRIKIIDCNAVWFGVTYNEDKPFVMKRLAEIRG